MDISFFMISWRSWKILFLLIIIKDGRHGQGITNIMQNINKPKNDTKNVLHILLLQTIEYMDTIRIVQFFNYNKSMVWILHFKLSSFCANEPSLYSRNVVGILIKLIFFGGGVFFNNHNSVVFTWIFCTRNMTCPKMGNDVLTFLYLVLIYIPLCLQCHVLIFTIF